MNADLSNIIEAMLFVHGESMKISRLAKLANKNESEVSEALEELSSRLDGRGLRLVRKEDEVMLSTAPETSPFVEDLVKEEFSGKLTRATLETLAIVAYHGPMSRPDIDFIRGVNSSFTLRNLLVSGLVEREINPKDKRTFIYNLSMKFLQYLGIPRLDSLPEYNEFRNTLSEFLKQNNQEEQ
ncbi:MAG: SMC-Scp complex subunit ScpB [Patescibacteria group bacterium]